VRQSDAHAWSEVWLQGQGWVRVDPTAWVAPERISAGQGAALAGLSRSHGWWRGLALNWTRLDLAWNRWVLGFDASQQSSLLGRWQRLQGWLLLLGPALALVPAVWWLQRPGADRRDPQRKRLESVLTLLRQRGLRPAPGEGLQDFCARAGRILPELDEGLQDLAARYNQLRFAPQADRKDATRAWQASQRELAQALRRHGRRPVKRAD